MAEKRRVPPPGYVQPAQPTQPPRLVQKPQNALLLQRQILKPAPVPQAKSTGTKAAPAKMVAKPKPTAAQAAYRRRTVTAIDKEGRSFGQVHGGPKGHR